MAHFLCEPAILKFYPMDLKHIKSYQDLHDELMTSNRSFLMLYKSGSEQSDCAYNNLESVDKHDSDVKIMVANVAEVRDIHIVFDIKSVPSLLVFKGTELKNVVKGCHNLNFYNALIDENLFTASSSTGETPQKRVTVYSTPTCSWCNTLKTHLKVHNIRFTDIDVSKDQSAAQAMVAKSGQQGVPQTDINGEMIVGFDKTRINKLLNING